MSGTKFCYEEAKDYCLRFEHVLPNEAVVAGGGKQKSMADCQNKCLEVQDCEWFSYNTKTRYQNCFLKSEFRGEVDRQVGVYGPKNCSGMRPN